MQSFHADDASPDVSDGWDDIDGKYVSKLKIAYRNALRKCQTQVDVIVKEIPNEWHVPFLLVKEKLQQLFDVQWTNAVWDNFIECLNENL